VAESAQRPPLGFPLPAAAWLRGYSRTDFGADLLASVIVTIMLIPQSLAYAMLAGLPPETGLYASMLPVVAYAAFGSSRVLAVGPVAVISLMTATALAEVTATHDVAWPVAAAVLAMLSGLFLVLLGLLRMGWIANFLSHSVISGFISASAIVIALGQFEHIFGVEADGKTLPVLLPALGASAARAIPEVMAIGFGAIAFLYFVRSHLGPMLRSFGMAPGLATACVRAGPVLAVVFGTLAVSWLSLAQQGVPVVGAVPAGLPALVLPRVELDLVVALLPSAILISLVGFVESISVGQSLAMRRRQRVEPDQELLGLGAANLVSGLSGGFPVTGGFSRSVVNYDAGAVTPMAGVLTAVAMAAVAAFMTPAFHDLPRAVLGAVIVVAVLPLVDFAAMGRALRHSRWDFAALALTFAGVLLLGVEIGIALGVLLSLAVHLGRSSRPHMAVVGRVPGTEHFRNVDRHAVLTAQRVLSVRVDESLWFGNVRFLEDRLGALVSERPGVTDLVLQCTAVNGVDGSAMETLERISERLDAAGVRLHLSEVKGPVMDVLRHAGIPERLTGRVFFTQHEAMRALAPDDEPGNGRAPCAGDGDGI
jgi:SulP family sulfate permease